MNNKEIIIQISGFTESKSNPRIKTEELKNGDNYERRQSGSQNSSHFIRDNRSTLLFRLD